MITQLNRWVFKITQGKLPNPTTKRSLGWSGTMQLCSSSTNTFCLAVTSSPWMIKILLSFPAVILLCFLVGKEDASTGQRW